MSSNPLTIKIDINRAKDKLFLDETKLHRILNKNKIIAIIFKIKQFSNNVLSYFYKTIIQLTKIIITKRCYNKQNNNRDYQSITR